MFRDYNADELRQLFNGKSKMMGARYPILLLDEFDAFLAERYGIHRPEVFRALMEACLLGDLDLAPILGSRVRQDSDTKSPDAAPRRPGRKRKAQ